MMSKKGMASFGSIVAMIGSILIACGVAWLIASNWHEMPSFLKILILVLSTVGAYTAGIILRTRDYEKIGSSLIVLGALLYTLSIFLIAQIFSTSVSVQGTSNLLFLAWIGVIITSYIFDSPTSLLVGLIELLVWGGLQYTALLKDFDLSIGMFALLYFVAGVFFYGLSLLHKSRDHHFAPLYRFWTALYFLIFTYILSFQSLLPMLWPSGFTFSTSAIIFFICLTIIAAVVVVGGIFAALNKNKLKPKEIIGFLAVGILLIILISSASILSGSAGTCYQKSCYDLKTKQQCDAVQLPNSMCIWESNQCGQIDCYRYSNQSACNSAPVVLKCNWINNSNYGFCQANYSYDTTLHESDRNSAQQCIQYNNNRESCLSSSVCKWNPNYFNYYSENQEKPLSLWFVWILSNIIFLALILLIVGYGTWQHSTALVNLSIIFFALDIITRYIGFIIDLGWYTSLSVLFITGGIILIFGGWMIEKWRRKLIAKTRE